MIKLNIQRFGHTNSTSNYELPQFIGTDKPQWLTDINQAFVSIDTAIHAVSVLANLNSTKIGDLNDLSTDNKIDLVSAINEVDSHTDSNTNTIAGHTTAISANTTAIGNLTDLDTVDKANLVSAINEVDLIGNNNASNIGNLPSLETANKNNLVVAINEIAEYINVNTYNSYDSSKINVTVDNETGTINVNRDSHISVAYNNDKSLAKIYGALVLAVNGNHIQSNKYHIKLNVDTGLHPSSQIDINPLAIMGYSNDSTQYPITARINTDGTIEFGYSFTNDLVAPNTTIRINIFPCLLFIKNFGDVPSV